jgi:hypothetical protein
MCSLRFILATTELRIFYAVVFLASKIKLIMFEMITVLILCMGVNQECTNPRRQVGATKSLIDGAFYL